VSLPLIVREPAQEDIREAVDWYERQSPGLGTELLRCLDACLSLIRRHPEMFPEVHRKSRMALLRRFPYIVIYRTNPKFIAVIAVMHGSRHPRRWRGRTEA
jgi:plasmid stabilization system protein ParE